MYHERCAILCQDSDRPGDARRARRPTPSTTAPRATGELHEVHRGGGEDHAGHARDGGARGGRRARRPRRRPRRRPSRRAHDPRRPLRLLRRRHHPGRRGHASPGTGTRRPSTPRASASSSSAAPRSSAARRPTSSRRARRSTPELFKVVADRLVQEAGVEPLLHCLVDRAHRRGRPGEGRPHGEQVGPAGDPRRSASSTPPATPTSPSAPGRPAARTRAAR